MDIREMKAGRELDALVAEMVMGFNIIDQGYEDLPKLGIYNDKARESIVKLYPHMDKNLAKIKPYSTNMAEAWEILNKFDFFKLENMGCNDKKYHATLHVHLFGRYTFIDEFAETAPLAICRAALLAMEDKA